MEACLRHKKTDHILLFWDTQICQNIEILSQICYVAQMGIHIKHTECTAVAQTWDGAGTVHEANDT